MTDSATRSPFPRLTLALALLTLAVTLIGCAAPKPPVAVAEFATRVLALNQPTSFGSTTNLDGRHLLTARHVLPDALEKGDFVKIGTREIDITRGVFRGFINEQQIAILALGVGRPTTSIRTDWAVIAPHPQILSPASTPRFAPPPTIGDRVWVIGYPGALGGTEPGAHPMVFPARVVAPPALNDQGIVTANSQPIDLSGSYAIKLTGSHPDLSGLSGGPVLALNPDGTVSVVGVASQQGSRSEFFGLIVHRWVFVAPIPDQIEALLHAPLPEPYGEIRIPIRARRAPSKTQQSPELIR